MRAKSRTPLFVMEEVSSSMAASVCHPLETMRSQILLFATEGASFVMEVACGKGRHRQQPQLMFQVQNPRTDKMPTRATRLCSDPTQTPMTSKKSMHRLLRRMRMLNQATSSLIISTSTNARKQKTPRMIVSGLVDVRKHPTMSPIPSGGANGMQAQRMKLVESTSINTNTSVNVTNREHHRSVNAINRKRHRMTWTNSGNLTARPGRCCVDPCRML